MRIAQYTHGIAQACPGLFTEHHILYHLPQERGWSYLHCQGVTRGINYEWPDDHLRNIAADEADFLARRAANDRNPSVR